MADTCLETRPWLCLGSSSRAGGLSGSVQSRPDLGNPSWMLCQPADANYSLDHRSKSGLDLSLQRAHLENGGEINTVPGLQVQYEGKTYLRIPKLLFPTEEHGTELVTPLMRDMMVYSREAIYAPVMSWFAGGPAASGAFADKGAIANRLMEPSRVPFDSPEGFGKKRTRGHF